MVKVCCCFDDGVVNDIRLIEILRKYHAKATFNLNPGLMPEHTSSPQWTDFRQQKGFHGFVNGNVGLKEMVDVYGDFQVASHGWLHLNALEVSPREFCRDAVRAREFLEDRFQRSCPGFAWPCGDRTAETERMLTEAGFIYGRTVEYTDDQAELYANPIALKSACHYLCREFYGHFQKAKEQNGVFYFWGHSYEMMDCEGLWQQTEARFAMLSADPEVQWIDVCDIVKQ